MAKAKGGLTKHARKRMHQRSGITAGMAESMRKRIYQLGIKHAETKGPLKSWMTRQYFKHKRAANMRLYGGSLYLFSASHILITTYKIPEELYQNLSEYVDAAAYDRSLTYKKKRESKKRNSLIQEGAKDEQEVLYKEIKDKIMLHMADDPAHFTVVSIVRLAENTSAISVRYISDRECNDWGEYRELIEWIGDMFSVGSRLVHIRDANGRYVVYDRVKNTFLE